MTSLEARKSQLLKAGFELPPAEAPRRLILSVCGLEKVGKTRLALSALLEPRAVAYIDINKGSEGIIQQFLDKKAYPGELVRLPIETGAELMALAGRPKATDAEAKALDAKLMKRYQDAWEKLSGAWKKAIDLADVIIVDTETEAWELIRTVRFGRVLQVKNLFYAPVNLEYRGLLNLAMEKEGLSVIFIRNLAEEYKDDKRTGFYIPMGFSRLPNVVQANITLTKMKHGEYKGSVVGKIDYCRHNPFVEGMEFPEKEGMLTFDTILDLVHS